MKNYWAYFLSASLIFLMIFVGGCYYDKVLPEPTDNPVEEVISFSQDLIPIFNQSCNIAGCHASDGHAPDLSASNAFASLTNGGFIDKADPANSELYQWLKGNRDTPMPLSGPDTEINRKVLSWIQQGAKNN